MATAVSVVLFSALVACDRTAPSAPPTPIVDPPPEVPAGVPSEVPTEAHTEVSTEAPTPVHVEGIRHLISDIRTEISEETTAPPDAGTIQLPEGLDLCSTAPLEEPDTRPYSCHRRNIVLATDIGGNGEGLLNQLFEGIGGRGLLPHCFTYSEGGTHAFTFAYYTQHVVSTAERFVAWNVLPGKVEFETEVRKESDHYHLELRAQPLVNDGQTYWFDHCLQFPAGVFDQHAKVFYFTPEPVEITGTVMVSKVTGDVIRNPAVDHWWDDLPIEGEVGPALLLHQPAQALNVALQWDDAAILKLKSENCIHVNPAVVGNGQPQTATGALYVFVANLEDALSFVKERVKR